ncbi:uncharacterized protein LOC117645863 [Thrips palmi]|uniref:Uncharacterized protein LOC117645863 n=1 Tax=Thrips palmi TaxID=161013 RepID=A0A6P8ZNG0_THRPL|nr:uncharacterized protein LOC117645863 [Thrips palmi]
MGPKALKGGAAAASASAACLLLLVLLVVLVAATEGLRCYVCNSKADSRCADPIQTAEEQAEGQDSDAGDNNNNNYYNNNNNQYDDQNEGLRMVDCKVAQSVRQAMEAVSGLLSHLGQRAPGGGDVWAAVKAEMRE